MKQMDLFEDPKDRKTHRMGPEFWFTNSPPRPTEHAMNVLRRYEEGEPGYLIAHSYGLKSSSTINHVIKRTKYLLERAKKYATF